MARGVKKIKFKLADKKSSLELIGKHLGMFVDRVDQTITLPRVSRIVVVPTHTDEPDED